MLDDRRGIVVSDEALATTLQFRRHLLGPGEPRNGNGVQLRHPSADELAVGILLESLFGGGINAHRIDAARAALHLELAEMDPGLEVQKVRP